jgi:hypothetical protein
MKPFNAFTGHVEANLVFLGIFLMNPKAHPRQLKSLMHWAWCGHRSQAWDQ